MTAVSPPQCPRCRVPLVNFDHNQLRTQMCPSCRGLAFTRASLTKAEPAILWEVQRAPKAPDKALPCPFDGEPMVAKQLRSEQKSVVIDGCPHCDSVWFDQGELATLRKIVKRHRSSAHGPAAPVSRPEAERQAQKILSDDEKRLLTNADEAVAKTGPGWTVFAILTDLPVEGYNPVYRRPVVTLALMAICVGIFVLQVLGDGLLELALTPSRMWSRPHTLLTAIFLHGGVVHLLVNLYFLKICGDNVEDRLGRGWFLLLFLVSGLVGSLAFGLLAVEQDIPGLGASGAISGILAAYVWFFPDVRLSLLPFWWFIVRALTGNTPGQSWIHLRAMFYIPIWFVLQVVLLALGVPGIGFTAHIGGFLAGLALTWWMAKTVPDARIATLSERIAKGKSATER